jgi:hypothetical protein
MTDQARRTRRSDSGSSSVAMAIVFPAVAILVVAFTQAAMLAAARNVALAAAEEGLRIARARGGTLAQGQAAATAFARREPVLVSPSATASGSTTIEVRVRGKAPSILPGIRLSINEAARGARERFTSDQP